MRLGFIGTGIMTSAMVTGLCRAKAAPERILVSPRNAEKASALASKFRQVRVSGDNQSVVDGSDLVVLAVRSQIGREVISELRFRADHRVVSLMALFTLATVRELVVPATDVCRVLPMPPVAHGVCPIVLYPAHPEVKSMLESIGSVFEVDDEGRLIEFSAVTALMAPYYGFLGQAEKWLEARGIDRQIASHYVSTLFHGLSLDATKASTEGLDRIVANAQTPGGLNEEALDRLRHVGWYEEVDRVLDAILARVQRGVANGTPTSRE